MNENQHQYGIRPRHTIERTETADEYGRRENCFINHRRHPFTSQTYIEDLKRTKETTEADGLVAEPGLQTAVLPNAQLPEEVFDEHQHHRKNLEKFLQDTPGPFSLSTNGPLTQELLIPVEELDLGYCLDHDVQDYLRLVSAKRHGNPLKQWLPLISTRSKRDEGLDFPPDINRLWALLHREIARDRPIISDTAANLVRQQHKLLSTSEYQELLRKQARIGLHQHSCIDRISPPLSPVSDDITYFVPDGDAAVIDLISEPSSPIQVDIEAIQGDIDSRPTASSTVMSSSPDKEPPQLLQPLHTILEETKIEVPVVLTSSEVSSEENLLTNVCLPLILIGSLDGEASNVLEEKGHFEDAFMTLLDDRRYYANKLVNQEQLDPTDSITRLPVPLIDFDIQSPEWTAACSTAKDHFAYLKHNMPDIIAIPTIPQDQPSERHLSWPDFSLGERQPITMDEFKISDDIIAKYLGQDPISNLSSKDFVSTKSDLAVTCILEDEEIDEAYLIGDMVDERPPVAIQQHEGPKSANSMEASKSPFFQNQECPDLGRPLRRKFDDEGARLLPRFGDSNATSIFLHNFMELKGLKRPRLNTTSAIESQLADTLPSRVNVKDYESLSPEVAEHMIPAPAPNFEVPSEKASFIIAVDLARPILRRLENVWTPEKLVDMDYSRHNTMTQPSGAAQPKEVPSPLSFEADISLSPSTGIIVTKFINVRQKPLPGSQTQTPLRERVQKVSQRYETLIVLVSESHPGGEFMGILAPSDAASYADFVAFTAALDGDVNVHLVPGAEETMASWVLALMSQHSHRLGKFLSSEETPWEIFLRRAGMNVVAAKVLSKTLLKQAGASGLALFLMMPVQERVAKYSKLLGGERVLRRTATILDRRWDQ